MESSDSELANVDRCRCERRKDGKGLMDAWCREEVELIEIDMMIGSYCCGSVVMVMVKMMMVVEDDSASSVKGGGVLLSFRRARIESSVVFEEDI